MGTHKGRRKEKGLTFWGHTKEDGRLNEIITIGRWSFIIPKLNVNRTIVYRIKMIPHHRI